MGLCVRKVKTASGATAVQIAHTKRGVQTIIEHLGSGHTEAQVAALVQVAKEKRLFTIRGVDGVPGVAARRCLGRGRGLPMMEVLTLPIGKTSTCLTLPSTTVT